MPRRNWQSPPKVNRKHNRRVRREQTLRLFPALKDRLR